MKMLLKSDCIYNGKIVNLFFDEVEYNGMLLKREVIRHRGGAAVLAEKDGKFAFVRQYRHPFGKEILEIPAGTKDGSESGEVTAIRELMEECGLKANKVEFITDFFVSPGYTDEVLNLYYANEFELVDQNFDDDEDLTVLWIDKNECFKMALNGEISDGKTQLVLFWYMAKHHIR